MTCGGVKDPKKMIRYVTLTQIYAQKFLSYIVCLISLYVVYLQIFFNIDKIIVLSMAIRACFAVLIVCLFIEKFDYLYVIYYILWLQRFFVILSKWLYFLYCLIRCLLHKYCICLHEPMDRFFKQIETRWRMRTE